METSAAITAPAEPDEGPDGRPRRLRAAVLVAVVAVLSLGTAVVALGGDGLRPVGTTIRGDEPAGPRYPATGVPRPSWQPAHPQSPDGGRSANTLASRSPTTGMLFSRKDCRV